MILYQDIHLSDKELYERFLSLWRNGYYAQALSTLKNSQFDTKRIDAETINFIQNWLVELQENSDPTFKSDKIKVTDVAPILSDGEVYFQIN